MIDAKTLEEVARWAGEVRTAAKNLTNTNAVAQGPYTVREAISVVKEAADSLRVLAAGQLGMLLAEERLAKK